MTVIQNVSRREFLAVLGLTGSGLVLGVSASHASSAAAEAAPAAFAPNVFLTIDPAGLVTIVCHRSEMGQGVRTAMPMIVADELEADWARVAIEQARGDAKYGDQNTDGSRSGRRELVRLRQAGAAARTMLEQAAARQWQVPAGDVQARNHTVVHVPSGRTLEFGALAAAAAALPVPDAKDLRLKPKAAFRFIGKDIPLRDGPDLVTGRALFGIDVARPGMRHAVIARPPVYGGRVKSVDTTAALKVPGVERVIQLEGTPPPSAFRPARRCCRHRAQHVGRAAGARAPRHHVGRWPECRLRLGGVPEGAGEVRAAARNGRTQGRRCRERVAIGRARGEGRLLRAAPRACSNGAARSHRRSHGRTDARCGPVHRARRARVRRSPRRLVFRSRR